MYDLDKILDDVREKYYKSIYLKRPSISWSKDYITDYFGEYTLYNNHITISRILNTSEISEEMLASVVYHESLHQDFQAHDDAFDRKARLFPNYYEYMEKLNNFASKLHAGLEYIKGYNTFTKNKKRVVYIVLPMQDEYPSAFRFCNKSMIVDFDAKVKFDIENQEEFFYVFLVKAQSRYHIVGWCVNGTLYKQRQVVKHKKFGDEDYGFQLKSDYADTYIIPITCCDYSIDEGELPEELTTDKCYMFNVYDETIKPDIEYIESYCEGYYKTGFDLNTLDCIPDFEDISIEKLKSLSKNGYASVWHTNAIYSKEPTFENLITRAMSRYNSWLLNAALDDLIKANKIKSEDIDTVFDIIKIAVLSSEFTIAQKYAEKYKEKLPVNNTILNKLFKEIEVNNK